MLDEQGVESKARAAVAIVRRRTNGGLVRSDDSAPTAPLPAKAPAAASAAVVTPGRPLDVTDDFLTRLARSMQAVARAKRTRIAEEVDLRRVARLTELRDGRRAEALRLRQLAAENRRAIDAWAESAKRRITNERQRRKAELESDLKRSLREENRRVDRRVKDTEAMIAAHLAEIEGFFAELEREMDPVKLAEQAQRPPAFPDLSARAESGGGSSGPSVVVGEAIETVRIPPSFG